MKKVIKLFLWLFLFISIILMTFCIWNKYMYSPWTRDARVRSDVINIAPDVSGWVTNMYAKNSHEVKKGEVLFTIDKDRYVIAYNKSLYLEQQAQASWKKSESIAARRQKLQSAISREDIDNSRLDAIISYNNYKQSQVETQSALLDLRRTAYLSPEDGVITNLDLSKGDYVTKGVTKLALTIKNSFFITGYFEETKLQNIKIGSPVDIWLMSGTQHLRGRVRSIDAGISNNNITAGNQMLPTVEAGYSWIRLAQRIPVNIEIDNLPPGINLSSGMSASVRVINNDNKNKNIGFKSIVSNIYAIFE